VSAVAALQAVGMSGPVTFDVFSGTYAGQVNLPGTITGLGEANPLVIQNATGENPVITSTSGYGFSLIGADYVTIRGLEITDCFRSGIRNRSSEHNTYERNYIHNVGTGGGTGEYRSAIYMYLCDDCRAVCNEITDASNGIYNDGGDRNESINNIIYDTGNQGIIAENGNDNRYYYNSIYVTAYEAFYKWNAYGTIVMNNILYASGSGHAFYVWGDLTIYTMTSDYNDLYAPIGGVGFYSSGGVRQTLAQWQAATGLDAHSISADPCFVSIASPFDLHIQEASPTITAGTPISDMTDDFDGDPRDLVTPDIGADEYTVLAPPGIVNDLTITICRTSSDSINITLAWSMTENAVQYHIYNSLEPYSGFLLLGSTTDTTYVYTDALIGEMKNFYYVTSDSQ
jgi:hypothetical protein